MACDAEPGTSSCDAWSACKGGPSSGGESCVGRTSASSISAFIFASNCEISLTAARFSAASSPASINGTFQRCPLRLCESHLTLYKESTKQCDLQHGSCRWPHPEQKAGRCEAPSQPWQAAAVRRCAAPSPTMLGRAVTELQWRRGHQFRSCGQTWQALMTALTAEAETSPQAAWKARRGVAHWGGTAPEAGVAGGGTAGGRRSVRR